MSNNNRSSHRQQMVSGTMWSSIERFSVLGIQLIFTFFLARFLSPADFGLMGMLVVFTLLGNAITESGFSQTLIREESIDDQTCSTVFWANLLLSHTVYIILWIAAPYIADFFGQMQLLWVSRAAFLVIPLGSFAIIQTARLTRKLQFRPMCLVSLTGTLLSCIIAAIFAIFYPSVWVLVLQALLCAGFRSAGYWYCAHWMPRFTFSYPILKRLFGFSRNLLISGVIGTFFNNIYTILLGRYYGASITGYFAQADRIRLVISNNSTQVVQNVSYPILTQVMQEGGDLRNAYRRIILAGLLAVGFVMTLIMCIGEDLFQLLMGSEDWRLSGQFLIPLGIAGILFPLHSINQNILLVKGLGKTVLWVEIARRTIMVSLILLSLQFDAMTFIWSYALYSILLIFVNLWVCGRPIGYTLLSQLRDIAPILFCFITIYIISVLSNHYLIHLSVLMRSSLTLLICTIFGLIIISRLEAFREVSSLLKLLAHKRQ